SDGESEEEETREQEEESFDPIPRTPEDGKEVQGLRISKEERMHEEEEADELYHGVDINQGRGLQVSQDIDDSHSLEAVSNILGIVHQYMHQEMTEAVREAVQTQTDRLQDSIQRENDEFLRTIDDNMKKIINEQVKSQVKAQVTRIFPIIKEKDPPLDQTEGLRDEEHALASTPSEPATTSAGRSTTRTQSRQMSASESTFAEEPMQTTYQMDEPSHPVFETGAEDQPIVQTSQHPD
nr:hypothetical protein [Tanacetum cinerariifolium]